MKSKDFDTRSRFLLRILLAEISSYLQQVGAGVKTQVEIRTVLLDRKGKIGVESPGCAQLGLQIGLDLSQGKQGFVKVVDLRGHVVVHHHDLVGVPWE